jgi:hypothetical protein
MNFDEFHPKGWRAPRQHALNRFRDLWYSTHNNAPVS